MKIVVADVSAVVLVVIVVADAALAEPTSDVKSKWAGTIHASRSSGIRNTKRGLRKQFGK